MKSLIILSSYHHKNTEKVAIAIANELECSIIKPNEANDENIVDYDLIGFGSGIYNAKNHIQLLNFVDSLKEVQNKNAFIISTAGAPRVLLTKKMIKGNHSELREKLQAKGFDVIDEFSCVGWNTNSILKYFGGLNKGRPNVDDLEKAKQFTLRLKNNNKY